MNNNYETEVVRRVFDNDEGHYLTVQPSPDFPGNVMLNSDPSEEDYFGKQRIDLPAAFMRCLGQALIDAANEAEGKK